MQVHVQWSGSNAGLRWFAFTCGTVPEREERVEVGLKGILEFFL